MNCQLAVLLILIGIILPAQAAWSAQIASEGYARPTFGELIQTMVLMGGGDINDPKVADEYGRLVYCDLYRKNFGNDAIWNNIRNQIVTRAQKKREYYRVKYEVVGSFELGRYDFKKQFFPISNKTAITNVGSLSLFSPTDRNNDCSGNSINSIFPQNVVLELNTPLTITGFNIPSDKVDKMMVRIEEAGNTDRRVYGRIRAIVTDARGTDVSGSNLLEVALTGNVTSVDFFLDAELTKPIGGVQLARP